MPALCAVMRLVGSFPCAVVVPLFNKAPHVRRCLDSILNQTLPASEIIVVDDGSSDGGLEIVRSYEAEALRIFTRSSPGPGGYAARNLAIHEARSPWVAFLDADDEWAPDHLETIASGWAYDGVFTGYETRLPDGRRLQNVFERFAAPRVFDFDAMLDLWLRQRACPLWTGALAFRRELLLAAGLFPEHRCKRGGDKDLWLRASARGVMYGIPRSTAIYHADSVNMVTRSVATSQTHCIWPTIEALLLDATPERARKLKRLYNMQVWEYVRARWRAGAAEPECSEGFFVREEPLRHAAIRAMQITANPGVSKVVDVFARLRRQWGGEPRV